MSLQTYISLRSYLSFLYLNRSSTLCRCRWQIDGASSIVFKYSVDSIYCWLLNSGNLTNFEHDICLQIKANPLTRWALLLDKIKIMKLHLKCDSIVQRWVGVVILIHMIFFYFSKKKNCSGCKYMFRSVSTMSCLRESFKGF